MLELTLEDAIRIARENNPSFLATSNDMDAADWDVRQAYGQLLPAATANGGMSWQGSGEQQIGSLTASELGFSNQPSYYLSNYSVGLSVRVSGQTLLAPGQAKVARQQTGANVRVAMVALDQQVTQAYLEVLRQAEEVTLATQELERARFNLRLAEVRRDAGTGLPLDVQQASVQVGRAEVTLLRTQNAERTGRLRLLQHMGLDLGREVRLTTGFGLTPPQWSEDDLYERAVAGNPSLEARRRFRESTDYQVKIAKSAYLPSLSLSTGFSGFTRQASSTGFLVAQAQASVATGIAQCEFQNDLYSRLADPLAPTDCTRLAFTDAQRNSIVSGNEAFPFNFETSPPSASLSISLPIFQGLSRRRQLEAAHTSRRDAVHQIREQELAIQADVAIGLGTVRTAYESALIEERNQTYADEQLRLARERYRLGSIAFFELLEAETIKAQADRARIAAIYAYHDAITALGGLVGESLRPGGG